MNSRKTILILGVLLTVAVCVMVTALVISTKDAAFVPPRHDDSAVLGMPSVGEALSYEMFYRDGMPYRFHVCMRVAMKDQGALVFFTNPEENDAWLKLRIMDANGEILGESGIVYPGEYIETVALDRHPPVGSQIVLKVMGYESETYHSIGAVSIQTMIIES